MSLSNYPIFASIGSLIIDDIIYRDGRKVHNVLGGAGVFAIYGMRLWQPNEQSKNVGYIIHKGFDYPKEIDDQINRLNISLVTKLHTDKHTTRGLNTFGDNDHRDFEYIHPIIRATTADFPDDWIKSVKILHLICSPERAIEIIDLWKQREIDLKVVENTKFLWEPLPWACLPENLDLIYKAVERVNIITPNHEELVDMLGLNFDTILSAHKLNIKDTIEYCGKQFIKKVENQHLVLVVRCSKFGTMSMEASRSDAIQWTPAFWNWKTDRDRVVDVTGAGNSFCGGYCYGYIHSNGDIVESALYGAVSASFTVEQVGVPALTSNECWNSGPSPKDRLESLRNKSCIFE